VRQREFGDGKHLEDIAAECALDIAKVNIGKVLTHDLLRGVVDKDVDGAKSVDVLPDRLLTELVVHQIAGDEQTLPAFLFNHGLSFVRVLLFLWQVHDGDIRPLASIEDGDRTTNSGAAKVRERNEASGF